MADLTDEQHKEIRDKVSAVLRDLHVEACDKIGRTVPVEHWDQVESILWSLDEGDLAGVWAEGMD